MSLENHKDTIIAALRDGCQSGRKPQGWKEPRPLNEDTAWGDIKSAVASVRRERDSAGRAIAGAKRRSHYVAIAKTLEAAHEGIKAALDTPELIDPFVWAWDRAENGDDAGAGMVDSDHVEAEIRKSPGLVAVLKTWAQLAAQEAKAAVAKHRPPKRSVLSRLIWKLALTYKKHTGRDPGRSFDFYKDVATGPFVRFIAAVAGGMGLDNDPDKVAEAIKKEQKNEEWFRVRQPHQDPAEVFAGFLMRQN